MLVITYEKEEGAEGKTYAPPPKKKKKKKKKKIDGIIWANSGKNRAEFGHNSDKDSRDQCVESHVRLPR